MAWKVQRRGVWRLWIVTAVIWTAFWSIATLDQTMKKASGQDDLSYANCNGQTYDKNWTYDKCIAKSDIGLSIFDREKTTEFAWWAKTITFSFVAFCVLTCLVAGIYYVVLWVVRGFRAEDSVPH